MAMFELDGELSPLTSLGSLLRHREGDRGREPYSPLSDLDGSASYKELDWLHLGLESRVEHSLPTESWFYQLLSGPESDMSQFPYDDVLSIDFGASGREVTQNFSHVLTVYCKQCSRQRAIAKVGRLTSRHAVNPMWIIFQSTTSQHPDELALGWTDKLACPDCMPFDSALMAWGGIEALSTPVSLDHFWTQAILDSRIMGRVASKVNLRQLSKGYEQFSPRKVHSILEEGVFNTDL